MLVDFVETYIKSKEKQITIPIWGVIKERPIIKDKIDIECIDMSIYFKKVMSITFENMSDKDIITNIIEPKIDSSGVSKIKTYKRIRFAYKSVKWIINFL